MGQGAGTAGAQSGANRRARPGRESGPAATAGAARQPRTHALQVRLAELYPQLFGEQPLPLKRGIFQDLRDVHPQDLPADELKVALGLHTRSTRYLTAVAAGQPRHDLAGQVVEAMAPEHVHHALLEVFRRRQQRSAEDLQPKLKRRLAAAFEASGLSRDDYVLLVRHKDESINLLLDEALADSAATAARDEALLRAFEASDQNVADFAAMYGRDEQTVRRALDGARKRRSQG